MRYCSVCGSDVHLYKHDRAPNDSLLAEGFLKVMGMSVHDTIGHQISGDVVALGEGVTGCRVGDRVALQGPGDGYGEYVVATWAQPLPDSITYEQGTFLEPLNVALNAVKASRVRIGDTILVQGAGTIGLLALQCARVAGASTIIVTEKSERRVKMAGELGVDVVIDVNDSDPVQRIRELTGGSGPAVVFECTGNPQGMETMVEVLPFHGQGVIVASYETPTTIDYNTVMLKSLILQGVLGMDNFFPIGVSLIDSGRVRVDSLYSSIVPLERINEAMMALLQGQEIGVLIAP